MSGFVPQILIDDVGDGSIDRAKKLLAGIPKGAQKAVSSALKRAGTAGLAYAARAVREEYLIRAGDFKRYTKTKRVYNVSGGSTTVDLVFTGVHIPLIRFDARIAADGRVSARVKHGSARTAFDRAFRATVGDGHTGIFERETDARTPMRELFGPSVPQMLDANDDLQQDLGDKIRETFEQRIDHEILAVMNGWRT